MEMGVPELIVGAVVLAIGLVLLIGTRRWLERAAGRDGYNRMSIFSSNESRSKSGADPLAEAEVYLAYGRKERAIAILEAASQSNPTREDIRKRLFEIKIGA